MPNIVDKFNVDGQEYHIEPPTDAVPTEDSPNAVQSGGVYTSLQQLAHDIQQIDIDVSGKVDKTTTVNGKALSTDITIAKADVGLGSVANTGDSATPASGGTTKFTTGGAYDFFRTADYTQWLMWTLGYKLGQKWLNGTGIPAGAININTVTANNKFFASIGGGTSAGAVYMSSDGINWQATSITSGVTLLFDVIYFKGLYVALTSNTLYWSSNGISWTQGATLTVVGMLVTNDSVIVCSTTNGLKYSTDGKTWNSCTSSGTAIPSTYGYLEFADGVFIYVAGSYQNTSASIYRSTNGQTFTPVAAATMSTVNTYGRGVGYVASKGTWYALITNSSDASPKICISTDKGVSWTSMSYSGIVNNSGSSGRVDLMTVGNRVYVNNTDLKVCVLSVAGLVPTVLSTRAPKMQAKYIDGIYLMGDLYNLFISCDGVNFSIIDFGLSLRVFGYGVAAVPGKLVMGGRCSTLFDSRCL